MAYMAVPNSFTTATTWYASAANANFAAVVTGITSGEKDYNIATCECSNITLETSVKLGGTAFLNYYYYSHTVTSGDISSGYISYAIDSAIVNSDVLAVIVTPGATAAAGYDKQCVPFTNCGEIRTGYAAIYLSNQSSTTYGYQSSNVEGFPVAFTVVVRAS